MSSPCLSGGGGRTYGFDLEIVKSQSTISTRTSQTSSPSSTLSESSNSPLAISTRKPRTPRKRPNQNYNEAAALLSTAYPNIFSIKHLTNHSKFTKTHDSLLLDESSDLLLPFRVFDHSGFLLHQPIQDKPRLADEPKVASLSSCYEKSSQGSGEVDFNGNYSPNVNSDSMELCDGYQEDFDAESILDEEIEEGIDSIMGNLSVGNEMVNGAKSISVGGSYGGNNTNSWYGNPMGFNFGGKFQFGRGIGMRRGMRALRQVDYGNWWNFPIVDMHQISPRLHPTTAPTASKTRPNPNLNPSKNSNPKSKPTTANSGDKKKKKKVEKTAVPARAATEAKKNSETPENQIPPANNGLLLKLNYDEVLNAWSDRGSPFSGEASSGEGNDVSARLAQIDLFTESEGIREASVLRYKEKRRTRLFSKKIRYQVRKVNADRRPRMKGRFVRTPNSSTSSEDQ